MSIYDEIDNIWRGLRSQAEQAGYGNVVARTDVRSLLHEAEVAASKSEHLLQPWLAMSELAIEALYATHKYALAIRARAAMPPTISVLVGRACGMAVAIRRLVISGVDEAANVVMRSFLENLDIATVALDDAAFAKEFAEAKDQKRFWSKNIARGQIHQKAEAVIRKSGVAQPTLADRRKVDWSVLSQATHSSFMSAFAGAAVISLATQDLIASPLGHLSIRGPVILDRLAKEAHDFMAVAIRLVLQGTPPPGFDAAHVTSEPLSYDVTGAFFTLQEIISKHAADIEAYLKSVLP